MFLVVREPQNSDKRLITLVHVSFPRFLVRESLKGKIREKWCSVSADWKVMVSQMEEATIHGQRVGRWFVPTSK
jgi:hypothetical protein